MNFETMCDGAFVTCAELVWQLGRSQPRLFLSLPASQDGRSGEVVAASPNCFASACSMARGNMRSFAEMITP
jgi:hypothetical protein